MCDMTFDSISLFYSSCVSIAVAVHHFGSQSDLRGCYVFFFILLQPGCTAFVSLFVSLYLNRIDVGESKKLGVSYFSVGFFSFFVSFFSFVLCFVLWGRRFSFLMNYYFLALKKRKIKLSTGKKDEIIKIKGRNERNKKK